MKTYKATKRRPKKHPTTIEIWSGNTLILRLWANASMDVEPTPNGPREYKASEIICESARFTVHQPAVVRKEDTGWLIRKLVAQVMLWDCFDKDTSERFADQFARWILTDMPVSTWRFDEASLMAGILECRQRSNDLHKVMDVSK